MRLIIKIIHVTKYLSDCWILCNLVSGKLETSGTNVIYEKAASQGIVLSIAKIRQIN